jgi:hypothetical protein
MEKKVVKLEKNLVKMEKVEKMRKILAILEKIIVTILGHDVGRDLQWSCTVQSW